MAYTLQQLSDFEDIRTLKHRYFRCIDTASAKELAALFTDNVTVEYRGGDYVVRLKGLANMLEFLANSFNSDAVAMHHGHMPEITLTGPDTAEGIWYLEDVFINLENRTRTFGSAIYRDRYRRVNGTWKIEDTQYDRIIEVVDPLPDDVEITAHYLAQHGRKPSERTDNSRFLIWATQSQH